MLRYPAPINGIIPYMKLGSVYLSSWPLLSLKKRQSRREESSLVIPNGYDPRQPDMPVKVIKGGSYLCAKNFCMRYRPSARHAQETTLGAAHIGFRTVINMKDRS